MLAWEGEGDGGVWWGLWWGCCSCCCCCCWYLLFRWSMKASLLRSMSALWRLVRASRLWAAVTVWRCSDVCTKPTFEKRRPLFPSVRYSRGYSRSSLDIKWPPPRSGSGNEDRKGEKVGGEGGSKKRGKEKCARKMNPHTKTHKNFRHTHTANRHAQVKANEAETRTWKKARREQERARWRNVRLFTIRAEWFPEGKLILFKLRMEEKEKIQCNHISLLVFCNTLFWKKQKQNLGV